MGFVFLTTINNDLKDVQRPWILKAILSKVPIGSRLLEVGAGDPHVANILSKIGYDVTIIDPYDGTGNGPKEYDSLSKQFPNIRFLRQFLTTESSELEPGSFDCIYSISVLEHVPDDRKALREFRAASDPSDQSGSRVQSGPRRHANRRDRFCHGWFWKIH